MSDEPITGFLRPTGRTGQLVLDVEDFPEGSWVHGAFTDNGEAAVEIHHQGARDLFLETAAENLELHNQASNKPEIEPSGNPGQLDVTVEHWPDLHRVLVNGRHYDIKREDAHAVFAALGRAVNQPGFEPSSNPEQLDSKPGGDFGSPLTGRPWEIVGRVSALPQYSNGEPAPDGELLVRLVNSRAMPVPEAFDGVPEVSLSICHPVTNVGKHRNVLAASMLTPRQARQLSVDLRRAADAVDPLIGKP